jgi:hypothetical protein
MGANPKGSAEQSAATMIFAFYLGPLTARDDKTYWKVTELVDSASKDAANRSGARVRTPFWRMLPRVMGVGIIATSHQMIFKSAL